MQTAAECRGHRADGSLAAGSFACERAADPLATGWRTHGIPPPENLRENRPSLSTIFVARGETLLGTIRVADATRPEAALALRAIHAMGIRTILLSGDSRGVTEAVAGKLGISEFAAELLPEDKQARVRELVARGHTVAMVGDGINDAPALIEAHVGVAMASGTDVARESADIVLLGNDLLKFSETLELARRTRRIIWANFAGTIAVDAIGILLAAAGFLNPLLAAFIHVSSELAFILNSARLLPGSVASGTVYRAAPLSSSPAAHVRS